MSKNSSENIINFFFPNKCARCRKPSGSALCEDCSQGIFLLDLGRCPGCSKLPKKCVCKKRKTYKRCISAYDFRSGSVRSIIYKLKSSGNKIVVSFLCDSMIERINKEYVNIGFDFVTYVPTLSSKRFSKGFDHAELLADGISRRLNVPLIKPPIKRVSSVNQKFQTGKDRQKNASLAFVLKKNSVICGKVLLIDDVMTSGSTLYRCAEVLSLAGADEVYCAVAATT